MTRFQNPSKFEGLLAPTQVFRQAGSFARGASGERWVPRLLEVSWAWRRRFRRVAREIWSAHRAVEDRQIEQSRGDAELEALQPMFREMEEQRSDGPFSD